VEEVTRFRDEIRLKPISLPESLSVDLADRVPRATFHAATRTLNLVPEGVHGVDLPTWVERALLAAAGE
jgi:hypothetical protein